MVVSSPTQSEQTGWPIGFWASELTHPLHTFQEAGYEVDLASTEGGQVEMDGYSDPRHESGYSAHDVITLGYLQTDSFQKMLEQTTAVSDVDTDDYDAVFLVGGQGPMYTFRKNDSLEQLFASFYASGKPSAVVCHATTLLLDARKQDGEPIVKNKAWTGFSSAEEDIAEQAVGQRIQPYRIEEEARKMEHTDFKVADPFMSYAIQDGHLITGQQQNSGVAAAQLVIEQLEEN
jgi:putative intracellular protease/amidase